ncbi:metal-dependent hydrolase [Legionella birminghamensis]|uniref:Endoribonuclease YbeY n=1 Tax=Legionella birminghamensis TaxID=28083 RepID=A0A378I9Q1_9GAMM|nr:rRNA maturation RNase YbeY [Legionella birminghamensis]KTC69294.1 metal-dependent hydrolase [Legionella birminghamensis]STX31556.1 metal-dependent hydrolase [Legionella birminghamensis]
MNYHIDLQVACENPLPFPEEKLINWAQSALLAHKDSAELTLRFVDSDEIRTLNQNYRKKDKPTNVLAFPSVIPPHIELDFPFLGDVIICPSVLAEESREQEKSLESHWAHIIIHGVLHLLGYDHIEAEDEKRMQQEEIQLLEQFGFSNPYNEEDNHLE